MSHTRLASNFLSRFPDWVLPCALVAGAAFIFFARALALGMTIFANDMDMAYSTQVFLTEQIHGGSFPLWDPYASSGIPFFVWAPIFYPPHLLLALFAPIGYSFALAYIFHFVLAGIGVYLFLKQLGAAPFSATIGALLFMFNGHLILRVFAGHFMYVYAAAWVPLIFYFAEKLARERRFRYTVAGGVTLGVQLLCAVTQIWLYTALLIGIYFFLRLFALELPPHGSRTKLILMTVASSTLMILLGVSIGAVYWLPVQASTSTSIRSGGLDFAIAVQGSLPPTHVLNLILPNLFGTDIDQNYWGYFLGYVSQIDSAMYVGVIPLILAMFALRDIRRPQVMALLVVGMCALVLSLGRFTPAYQLAYNWVPGLSTFRIPARMLILFCFTLSVLAGLGMNTLERTRDDSYWFRRFGWILLGLGAASLAILLVTQLEYQRIVTLGETLARMAYANAPGIRTRSMDYALKIVQQVARGLPDQFTLPSVILSFAGTFLIVFRRVPQLALSSLGVVIALDLVLFSWRYLVVIPTSDILSTSQKGMLTFLDLSPEAGRVYSEDNLLSTNMGSVFHFANVQSDFPQAIKQYRDLIVYGLGESIDDTQDRRLFKRFNPRALRLLNVTTALMLNPIDSPDWRQIGREQVTILASDRAASDYPVPQPATAYVYKNINALPRAFVVYHAQVIADDKVALAMLYRDDFNPERTVILDQPAGALGVGGESHVEIQKYTPNQIELHASTDVPGILVLSEVFAPGWAATIDNQSAPVLRADYVLRGIYLPTGSHQVQFNYTPPGLMLGLIISMSALFVSVVIARLAA